jgi:uncharacterized protein YodC (DUF2158 family)
MTLIKSGDLVVLKSGGPVMTVDAVNTDIFDDDKITGVFCVWFVGEKLERVRFDHRAIELAQLPATSPGKKEVGPEEATGDYKVVLDEMAAAMNIPSDADRNTSKAAVRKSRRTAAAKSEDRTVPPALNGLAS